MSGKRRCWLVLVALAATTGCRTVVWYGHSPGRVHRVDVVERANQQQVLLDGAAGPAFDGVGVTGLLVEDDGTLVYPARRGNGWYVVHGDRTLGPWDGIGGLVLSPGGEHLAWAALRGRTWQVVVDGKPGPGFDAIFEDSLRLSSTGVAAYVAERGGRAVPVVGTSRGRSAAAISSLRLTDDGAHVAWLARDESGQRAVVDQVEGRPWLQVSDLLLLPDGRALHAARSRAGWWMVGGGQQRGPYEAVGRPRFEPTPGLVFAASRDGAWFVVTEGVEGPPFDAIDELVVAPDGRVGYVARRGRRHAVVVDGLERGTWRSAAGLSIGPAGRWAIVVLDDEVTRIVHDAGEERVANAMPDTLAFGADGRWGVMAGDAAGLFIAVENGVRREVDAEEIAAAAARRPGDAPSLSALLQRWVQVEVARAARNGANR